MQIKLLASAAAIALVATVSVASAEDRSPTPMPAQFTTIHALPAEALSDKDAAGVRGQFTVTSNIGRGGPQHVVKAMDGGSMSPQGTVGFDCLGGACVITP